ncbi:MAG: hypothetical protein WD077_13225 [Bacteroidia bacterium]
MTLQTIRKSIGINAPKEKVWNVLLQDETYRIWTSAFEPTSYAVTDWKEGSKQGIVPDQRRQRPGQPN